jgi:hypothetical protein
VTSTAAKQEPDHPSVQGGMDAAAIVSRWVNPATGALGTLQSGEIGMLRREEYLIQDAALADQDSWRGTVPQSRLGRGGADADNVLGLTLDTLQGEAFIDWARTAAPDPKPRAAQAAAKGRLSPDR